MSPWSRRKVKNAFHDQALNEEPLGLEDFLESCVLDERGANELRAESMSLNLLRSLQEETEPSANFNERTLRRLRVANEQASLRYWSPAICGALVAVLILAAVLQVFNTPQLTAWSNPSSEARLTRDSQSPLLHTPFGRTTDR
ncbi:MAG: hypothetical protein JNJ45_05275 [Chthonomonas sp.]|nr:hypothetical protein [Chthonomonas sp.]